MSCYFYPPNERNCAGQIATLEIQCILFFTVENCTRLAGFFFYAFDKQVYWMLDGQCAAKQCGTACIEPLWSSVCNIAPDADSCTLAKLKRVLWVRILYIIYCRWWRRAACFLPKHQSLAFCSLAHQSQRLGLLQAQSWLMAAGWETKASLIQSASSAARHRRRSHSCGWPASTRWRKLREDDG